MLLAAPMTAAAKLVFESMAVTLPLAQLLAGAVEVEAPLTPRDNTASQHKRDRDDAAELGELEGPTLLHRPAAAAAAARDP